MILEVAEIEAVPGHEAALEAAVAQAAPLFRAAHALSLALHRSVETPSGYRLIVGWETVADHMAGFRRSPAFGEWRALIGPHVQAIHRVEHLTKVVDGFGEEGERRWQPI